MPCYTIQLNSVEISAMRPDIHAATDAAFKADQWRIVREGTRTYYSHDATGRRVVLENGRLTSRDLSTADLATFRNTLAREYSQQTVYAQAKRQGFTIRQTGPQTYEVQG